VHGSPPEITRRPVVLSTTAESIKSFQDNAAEVVLVRCTDQSDLGMTQDGLPVPVLHDEPVVQRVVVRRSENHTWRIGQITTNRQELWPSSSRTSSTSRPAETLTRICLRRRHWWRA